MWRLGDNFGTKQPNLDFSLDSCGLCKLDKVFNFSVLFSPLNPE